MDQTEFLFEVGYEKSFEYFTMIYTRDTLLIRYIYAKTVNTESYDTVWYNIYILTQ